MTVIVFVTVMLIFAAVLIFWKPGQRTKYRFLRLSFGNLLIHLMDALITFVNTPDLQREGNPLVSKLGYGWGALFLANLVVFVLIVISTWWFCGYEYVCLEASGVFDYFMKLLYGEKYKPVWFWYKFSKNYRAMAAVYGYVLYWGLTAAAPIFVIGWMLDMLHIYPSWWNSRWIAVFIGMTVCLYSMYKWARDGYHFAKEQIAGKKEALLVEKSDCL